MRKPINRQVWFFLYFFNFVGLNNSKMANEWFRTYSNTCWIVLGTSKMFIESGPLDPFFYVERLLRKMQNNMVTSFTNVFISQNFGFPFIVDLGKDGHRKIPNHRPTKSWKSWIWDQDLSNNMHVFPNMVPQYLLQNTKLHFKIWEFGSWGIWEFGNF